MNHLYSITRENKGVYILWSAFSSSCGQKKLYSKWGSLFSGLCFRVFLKGSQKKTHYNLSPNARQRYNDDMLPIWNINKDKVMHNSLNKHFHFCDNYMQAKIKKIRGLHFRVFNFGSSFSGLHFRVFGLHFRGVFGFAITPPTIGEKASDT